MLNFFFRKYVKWQKYWLWRGVKNDIKFIEIYKGDLLDPKAEDKLRAKLADERKKQKPSDDVIQKIAEDIATAQAVRMEYEKLKILERELPLYMSLL